jgi:hypothetical protein
MVKFENQGRRDQLLFTGLVKNAKTPSPLTPVYTNPLPQGEEKRHFLGVHLCFGVNQILLGFPPKWGSAEGGKHEASHIGSVKD